LNKNPKGDEGRGERGEGVKKITLNSISRDQPGIDKSLVGGGTFLNILAYFLLSATYE
jgi:hypothetical protein